MWCDDAVDSVAAAASSDDVMESRGPASAAAAAAARPSSFVQQLQSCVVDVSSSQLFTDDVERPAIISPPSSSTSSLHRTSRDPLRNSLDAGRHTGRCVTLDVTGDVTDDVTLITSASPAAEYLGRFSPSSSTSAAARDPLRPSVALDDFDVTGDVTDDVMPASSPPVADDPGQLPPSPTPPSPPESSAAATFIVPALSSLLGVADRKSADHDAADVACRRPLSSGWATALAAATIAGKAAAATAIKRRPNAGKPGGAAFNIRASRSLFCLTTSNPIRKLSISVVEWKYPLHSSQLGC